MLKLKFPFSLDKEEVELDLEIPIERKENIISFGSEYKFVIEIPKGKCLSIQKIKDAYVYVFEFEDINDAIEFENCQICLVKNSTLFSNPELVEREIIEYAKEYIENSGDKKRNKKKLVEDENGFMSYV